MPTFQLGFTIVRSDGIEKVRVNNKLIVNGPKTETDANGRKYQKLTPGDPKEQDWKKKLGIALTADLPPEEVPEDTELLLRNLPTGYSLWVHSIAEHNSGGLKKKRTDVYLYGHPLGPTKRYRSSEEFRAHLLWLATNSDRNPKNCLCKHCKGMEKPTAIATAAEAPAPTTASTNMQSEVTLPIREQLLDSDPSVPYLYRPGELVWFNKGTTWGLAVICRRQMVQSVPGYYLQPLSHPLQHGPPEARGQDDLRPYLAWTLPRVTHPGITGFRFEQVPWTRLLNGEYGPGDTEVDGSILAGTEVNISYTLFTPLVKEANTPNQVQYAGMFLGAEKIWIGEPVSIKSSSNTMDVMIIDSIVEDYTTTTKTNPNVAIIGDIYSFIQMVRPLSYNDRKNWPTPSLPPRMVADYHWRNNLLLDKKTNIWHEWQLKESKAKRGLLDIKGRWYESRRLLPILRPDAWELMITCTETSEPSTWMNSRFDAPDGTTLGPGALLPRKTRLDAFGRSVPENLKITSEPDEFSSGGDLS